MESVFLRHAISASLVLKQKKQNRQNPFANNTSGSWFRSQTWRSQLLPIRSKQSHFQGYFQDYAKPSRLLQVEEVKVLKDNPEEKVVSSYGNDVSRSLYKVELGTSRFSGSSLSDTNAGVLLCLIDENGDSILQRIPASSDDDESLHFQRGSLDEFTFEGPRLGRVKAMWIGLESGQWRLDKASLIVICGCKPSPEQESEKEEVKYIGVKYDFQAEDIQLGEGSEVSMLELRPYLFTELSKIEPSALFAEPAPPESQPISNEQSMKEYADLKLSLLLYDALLVLIGASAASFSAGEHAALAFLAGGVGGFLYLLLLQRSVDGISAPESSPENSGAIDRLSRGYKGPISSIALAIGFALFAEKYGSRDFQVDLTAKDLVLGMMGFLACKVSVVLAAFKPVPKGFED